LPAYRLSAPFDRPPLRRRLSGLALAVGVNIVLLLVLLGLGIIPPPPMQRSKSMIIDLLPESRRAAATQTRKTEVTRAQTNRPVPKPPPIILPVKPTITPPPAPSKEPAPWIELSKEDLAASDISKLQSSGAGGAGDSEVVGHGPNGEALYNAEWAREPSDAELSGYLPRNAPDGYGLIMCKTLPQNRVDDCIELEQDPPGSHLASAVRQAAWQFRVRPPRKGGRPLIGSWVRIRIDYYRVGSG
jgi:periplasmic protein TonB